MDTHISSATSSKDSIKLIKVITNCKIKLQNNMKVFKNNKTSTPTPSARSNGPKYNMISELGYLNDSEFTMLSSSYLDGFDKKILHFADNEAADEEIDYLANYSPKFVNNNEKLLIKQFYSKVSVLDAHLKGKK